MAFFGEEHRAPSGNVRQVIGYGTRGGTDSKTTVGYRILNTHLVQAHRDPTSDRKKTKILHALNTYFAQAHPDVR